MSCAKGVKERIVLSLDSAIAAIGLTPEYRRLLNILDSTKYPMNSDSVTDAEYNSLFNQYSSVCIEDNPTKKNFIDCMKFKVKENLKKRYNEEEVTNKLNEYIREVGNNSFAPNIARRRCTGRGCTVMGGRRTQRKKRTYRKKRIASRRR